MFRPLGARPAGEPVAYPSSGGRRRVVDDVNPPWNDLAVVEVGANRHLFAGVTKGDAPVAECRQAEQGVRG